MRTPVLRTVQYVALLLPRPKVECSPTQCGTPSPLKWIRLPTDAVQDGGRRVDASY